MIHSLRIGEISMRILNISIHPELLVLSTAYLQALGFHVAGVSNLRGVSAQLEMGEEFDMLILCHTLSNAQKRTFCESVTARCPSVRVLELYLNTPRVTQGVAVEAATEFHRLMGALASEDADVNIGRPWGQPFSRSTMGLTTLTQ